MMQDVAEVEVRDREPGARLQRATVGAGRGLELLPILVRNRGSEPVVRRRRGPAGRGDIRTRDVCRWCQGAFVAPRRSCLC